MGCLDRVVWTLLRPSKAAFLVLVGCTSTPDPWGCVDEPCREQAALSEWETSPGDAVEHISQLPDELEKIAMISTLVDHFPGTTGALCELLPHGMSRERCLYTANRSSVWQPSQESSRVTVRAGIGPARSVWSPVDFEPSDLIRTKSSQKACSDEVDPHACAWGWARAHAKSGDAEEAARMCAAVRTTSENPNRWRHFCFLSAAEVHIAHWERSRFADSARLCGASGPFRAVCVDELIGRLAALSPGSDVADERVWVDHLLRANAVQQAWSDSPMLMEVMDRFWAVSMRASVVKSKGLSGDSLGRIPSLAVPHLRAALAEAVVSRWEGTHDFEGARDRVLEALSTRMEMRPETASRVQLAAVEDHWPVDRDGEAHLSAASYFGDSRRTLAMDPITDVELCVLEAFARTSPPAISEIEKAKSMADERLKWTAARLMEQLKGG